MAPGIFVCCSLCGKQYHTHSGKQIYCSNWCSFWAKVDKKESADECWPWKAKSKNEHGYGIIRLRGERRNMKASRYAWILTNGEIGSRHLSVCHKCDNPSCCNPHHLFLGTQKENAQDMVRKGRQWIPTQEHREKIRALLAGKKRDPEIGRKAEATRARNRAIKRILAQMGAQF